MQGETPEGGQFNDYSQNNIFGKGLSSVPPFYQIPRRKWGCSMNRKQRRKAERAAAREMRRMDKVFRGGGTPQERRKLAGGLRDSMVKRGALSGPALQLSDRDFGILLGAASDSLKGSTLDLGEGEVIEW